MPVCVWVCVQINVMVALYQKCDMMYRADPVFGAWCLVLTSQSKKKGCYSGLRSKLWPVSARTIFLSSSNSKPFFFCGTSSLSNIATTTLAAGKKQTSNDRLHQKTRWMVPFWQFSLTCRETLPYMDQCMLNGCVCVLLCRLCICHCLRWHSAPMLAALLYLESPPSARWAWMS